jgi:hypothetical protein
MRIARHAARLVPGKVKEIQVPPGTADHTSSRTSCNGYSKMLYGDVERSGKNKGEAEHPPTPLQQERIRSNWKRISSGLSQSDQKKILKAVTLVML